MEKKLTLFPSLSLPARFIGGVILILALSLLIFYLLMAPPFKDLSQMAAFLSATAVGSTLAGYGAYRLGWMEHSPTIRLTLLGGYALSSALTFLNVYITAQLMFNSTHDLLLAMVLLLFAAGIAFVLGYFFSNTLTDRIQCLDTAAHAIADGNLQSRAAVKGQDELAALAKSFNDMAARLEMADLKQRELDILRKDLIAWISHDLQTPLASIQAVVEALADGLVEDPDTTHRYLNTALRDIRSLSVLIDDLFQMAQLDAGGMPLDYDNSQLSDLISDTLEVFSVLAKQKGIQLQGKVGEDVDPVYMDIRRIGRVLNNLIHNALRHTPPGGKVEVNARRTGQSVLVEVIDTGEGILPDQLPMVFERFYRGEKSRSRATGGAGLGLAIAKGFVEAHGGHIQVESNPGQQTRFSFTLPSNH